MNIDGDIVTIIRDMQRDLDAYNTVYVNIIGYLGGKFGKGYKPCIMEGLAASEEVNANIEDICKEAFELRGKYEEMCTKYDEMVEKYESVGDRD